MSVRIALFEDILDGASVAMTAAAPRGVYVRSGSIAANGTALTEDTCTLFEGPLTLSGRGEAWTWEFTPWDGGPFVEGRDRHRVIVAHEIAIDPRKPVLLRADRVDFPPDIVTPKHGHAGAGIRRLLHGRLLAEIGDRAFRVGPGEAWYESGTEPVVGNNIAPASGFVRMIALPPTHLGITSFTPWTPEEGTKPRGVSYRLFFDTVVTIPG